MNKAIVLGSINMDLVVTTNKAPGPGETLFGLSFNTIPGGKGANQAVAIARQDGIVKMIGKVGCDGFSDELINQLKGYNVDTSEVQTVSTSPTGVAFIVVENSGQNRIIVVSGANSEVSQNDVDKSSSLFNEGDFLVMQLEIPLSTVEYAAKLAKSRGLFNVLNCAPGTHLDRSLLKMIDFLILNESEAEVLTGKKVIDIESALYIARELESITEGVVILTLGSNGSVACVKGENWHTSGFKVEVKDTTAAGDAFIGGLISSLIYGRPLQEAIIYANASGALATTRFGAQPSLPDKVTIENFIKNL